MLAHLLAPCFESELIVGMQVSGLATTALVLLRKAAAVIHTAEQLEQQAPGSTPTADLPWALSDAIVLLSQVGRGP